MKRGEIWWYEHPYLKPRPALILTRDEAIGNLRELFTVLATTRIRGLPTEVEIGAGDGMPRNCVLNADHVDAVDKSFLSKRITQLGAEKMDAVCRALAVATSCS
jgi:mRNA interferase MazF